MSERSEIKRDGAKAQKNSGRGQIQKGDARLGPFIVDYKEYEKGFRITPENWGKICEDAFRSGRAIPALKLILGDNPKVRLWVVEESIIEEYLEWYREKYE